MMKLKLMIAATALAFVASGDFVPAFADAQEQREYERSAAHSRAARDSRGGAYVDESRIARYRLNNSGSGANTRDGGSYSVSACCTFAPGELPKGDEVQMLTLFDLSRGIDPEGVEVQQAPPRYHWAYPSVRVYDTVGDVLDALGF